MLLSYSALFSITSTLVMILASGSGKILGILLFFAQCPGLLFYLSCFRDRFI